jgi:uncharacterized protein
MSADARGVRIMSKRFAGVMSAALAAAVWLGPAAGKAEAQAKGPAFDCARASGEVEKLICSDESLAALDRELDGVYKAALAKARDDVPKYLRTEQRGWIKGRDECWKAAGNPLYLTESWVATDVRGCVEGQYRMRIAELQVQLRLLPPQGPVFFTCNNQPADEFIATFFESAPPAAAVERGDRTVIVYRVSTASGARYEGQNLSLRINGKEATITYLGEELKCTVR